ncbi:hypothetical protein Fmac_011653 [Flemingia macrophylla]|uniref:Rx N-terminal domain-containing protein n=1 Tax=Flemingia macrophylla TaxID=520843 RepID=A0ABD1MN30_9FABA
MAAELVGGAFLSAIIQTLFDKLATREMVDFIRGVKHDIGLNLLDKLKIALRSVDALVNHAEERQTTDLHTREWLNDLKDIMFKAEDLMDEISVLASSRKLEAYSGSSSIRKVSCPSLGRFREKMESIIENFENLVKQKDVLGLREGVDEKTFKNFQTTSLVGKSSIYGRNADKDNVIKHLLSASNDFSFRFEGHRNNYPSKRTRYMSYSKLQLDDLEKMMATCENLRTFLPSQVLSWPRCLNNEAVSSLISKHRSLRILSLSHCGNFTVVPDFLGDLIHLRYLDLSVTPISKLPESTCSLHNLQTLLLLNCACLAELPQKMGRLTNLRCLDIRGTKLSEIPLQMGNLTNLQTLTGYVLGSEGGSGIEELKNFPFLKGKISISNLQNIIDPQEAIKENLLRNMQLDRLMLSWSANADDSKNVRNILHWLEPPKTLKKLTIRNFGSTSFPPWLGDFQFLKLASICLYDCVNCVLLPTLGQLPSLKALSLVGFSSVIYVDEVFYNKSSMEMKQFQRQEITPFKCLETLHFENMPQWQEWLPFREEKGDEKLAFPCLKQLYIKYCPQLKAVNWIQKLPTLEKIVIEKCEQLEVAVPPNIRELQLECCEKASIQRPLPRLLNLTISSYNEVESLFQVIDNGSSCIQKLRISSCPLTQKLPCNGIANTLKSLNLTNCENIEFPMNQCFSYLESLCISCSCNSLRSFTIDMFPKMAHLEIRRCQNLESLVVSGVQAQNLQSLNSLKICECPNFVSFPEGGLAAPNLTNLHLEKCKNLNSLPCQMNKLLPSLMTLNLKECPELESFSEGGLPDSLNFLEIFHCAKLFTNREKWNLQKLPSLRSFAIAGSCQDEESFPERWLLPPTLTSFHILALWNLKYLYEDNLQRMTSLETLGIACCPKLQYMPAKLPSSISSLHIMTSICSIIPHIGCKCNATCWIYIWLIFCFFLCSVVSMIPKWKIGNSTEPFEDYIGLRVVVRYLQHAPQALVGLHLHHFGHDPDSPCHAAKPR